VICACPSCACASSADPPANCSKVAWVRRKVCRAEHLLDRPGTLVLVQTFEMVFSQYDLHPEYKSLAADGTPCKGDTTGLLNAIR
jgi:hypothetical protein